MSDNEKRTVGEWLRGYLMDLLGREEAAEELADVIFQDVMGGAVKNWTLTPAVRQGIEEAVALDEEPLSLVEAAHRVMSDRVCEAYADDVAEEAARRILAQGHVDKLRPTDPLPRSIARWLATFITRDLNNLDEADKQRIRRTYDLDEPI